MRAGGSCRFWVLLGGRCRVLALNLLSISNLMCALQALAQALLDGFASDEAAGKLDALPTNDPLLQLQQQLEMQAG